jgi:hypothetical protein
MAKKTRKAAPAPAPAAPVAPAPAPAAAAADDDGWIVCTDYTLTVKRKPGCIFQLDLNNNSFQFRVTDPDDQVGLVQQITRVLADRWPSPAFEFKADTGGNLIDIQ